MSLLSMLTGGKSAPAAGGERVDPGWVRSAKGGYFHFLDYDLYEDLVESKGGVFVIWHGGIKPGWLYVGRTKALGAAFAKRREDKELRAYEPNGHLFVSWALVPEPAWDGVAAYLIEVLKPTLGGKKPSAAPISVYIPG